MSAVALDPPPKRQEPWPCPSASELSCAQLYPLSVAQYHAMIDAGVFAEDERCELLDGLLVKKMSQLPLHSLTVRLLCRWFGRRLGDTWTLGSQAPIALTEHEPEPDLWVARGPDARFADRHPGPAETALIVEVSDSSLSFDRGRKLRLYAAAGIPEYWIVNLVDRQVEVHREPLAAEGRYAVVEIVRAEGVLNVTLDNVELGTLPIAELLP